MAKPRGKIRLYGEHTYAMRTCIQCQCEKPLTGFSPRKNRGPEAFNTLCKDCHAARLRQKRRDDPDRYREYSRRGDAKRSKEQKEARVQYHREKVRGNPGPNRERVRAWAKANPERRRDHVRADKAKRRAKSKDSSFTVAQWTQLCEIYSHRCLCCGKVAPLTADHIQPLSMGGSNSIENIQPLCMPCNSRKYNRTIDYRPVP